jgi:hypothetical protein
MLLDEFEPLVGRQLLVDCDPRSATLTLTEAYPLRQAAFGDRQPFMLIFRSEPEVVLVSGSYVMRCGLFGPASIHILPVAPTLGGPPGNYYQAVFN